MPTYRSISIKLHSQFDIETYPEYIPRSRSSYAGRGMPTPTHTPVFDDEATSTCNVYIPVYPNSQFWLSYAVYPPVPEDQHFLFKLYINNAHVVSWSTGKEDEWKGKTMFALFEMEDEEGRKRVEKRLLLFSAPKEGKWEDVKDLWDEKACLEIKVHRARGKKRVERVVEKYSKTEHGMCERGVSLVSAGRAGSEQPKRFYKFALVDPVDKPFATFRYFYRTWAQIRELGLSEDEVVEDGESNALSVIEPQDEDESLHGEIKGSEDIVHRGSETGSHHTRDGANDRPGSPFKGYFSKGSPGKRMIGFKKRPEDHERVTSPDPVITHVPANRRLFFPPSCRFDPPERSSRPMPTIPQKHDMAPSQDTSYQPHPVFPIDDWEMRTPSPVQSLRETISTPTLNRTPNRGLTPTGWLSAIGNAWRRRGTPSNLSSDDGSRAASRSDSRGVH